MIIKTERLTLRPFCKGDESDLLEYLKEIQVHCFVCMKICSIEEAKREVEKRAEHKELYFAIVLNETGKVIGEIDSIAESMTPEEENSICDTYSPCWMLNSAYQKKGYAYEAAYAYFDYLFKYMNARRIYAYTEEDNYASQNLCKKLGMRQEGLFLDFVTFVNDESGLPVYENTYQYAILKKEWENGQKYST